MSNSNELITSLMDDNKNRRIASKECAVTGTVVAYGRVFNKLKGGFHHFSL